MTTPASVGIVKPLRVVSLNARWPGYSSTRLKALAWPVRMRGLVKAVAKQNPDIILTQEMGKVEAAAFFAALQVAMKRPIGYDRSQEADTGLGLNCVGWAKDVLTRDSSLNIDLPDYDQYPGRSAIIVKLKDKKGNRVRGGSTHNPVKTNADVANQEEFMHKFFSAANDDKDDWPLILGVDTNNRQADTAGMWATAERYGYDWKRVGIDALLWNFGAKATNFKVVDLGTNSDHNMTVCEVTTNKK